MFKSLIAIATSISFVSSRFIDLNNTHHSTHDQVVDPTEDSVTVIIYSDVDCTTEAFTEEYNIGECVGDVKVIDCDDDEVNVHTSFSGDECMGSYTPEVYPTNECLDGAKIVCNRNTAEEAIALVKDNWLFVVVIAVICVTVSLTCALLLIRCCKKEPRQVVIQRGMV